MRKYKKFDSTDLPKFGDHQRNRVIFEWLSDDQSRKAFYGWLCDGKEPFAVPSRAWLDMNPCPPLDEPAQQGHREVYLICQRDHIEQVLENKGDDFSNLPYRLLGAGSFMLALDPGADPNWHALQRECGRQLMCAAKPYGTSLINEAIEQARVMSLAQRRFDLAEFAEQVALRYCALLFGYARTDHGLLERAARAGHAALTYINLGRHFVSDPLILETAKLAMAQLLARSDALMDEYGHLRWVPADPPPPYDPHPGRSHWPEGVTPPAEWGLGDEFIPLLKGLACCDSRLSGQQRAMMAVGLLVGIVGNVQAAVCIAVQAAFEQQCETSGPLWCERLVSEALNANPPVPFLPRRVSSAEGVKLGRSKPLPHGAELILCLGAATPAKEGVLDALVFGEQGPHGCIGRELATPLIVGIVRTVLELPGLAQSLDPSTGEVLGLEKRWGFACTRYPLEYRREHQRRQQPLQVIMRIKSPVSENAARLKQLIREGAPTIQRALDEARHVHFAWFQLVNDETQLALQTIYDGDFDAYIQHFALKVDDLFDLLFQYVEDAPPLPVRKFPEAFVDTVRRFNRAPLGGYFYSAYPWLEVPDAQRRRP